MKIKDKIEDILSSYLTGFIYALALACILILLVLLIDSSLFDNVLTLIIIFIFCFIFFISGLKVVKEKNLGFLIKYGKRDFNEYYSEGWWWIFPIWSFKQTPHFNIFNESEEIRSDYITSDELPVNASIKYYWQLKNPEDIDNKFSPSYLKDKLTHELGIFIRSRHAIELLTDSEISNIVMINYLVAAGERIGITIFDVFPNINYESQYLPVVRKYQEKYKDLKFEFDNLLMHQNIKLNDIEIYKNQLIDCVTNLKLSNNEAMNFLKVYKNQINMNENTYNVGNLNEILNSVIKIFNK